MTAEGGPDTPSPSFAAPMDPAHYLRRIVHEPHQATAAVTAQRDLFVLAHLGIPRVDAAEWRLQIAGLVERPAIVTFDDILRLPARQVETFHQCAGAPRRPDLAVRRIANVVWRGADLADLLQTCGVRAEARFLWAYGLDHGDYDGVSARWYVKDMPLTRLAAGGVLLAYEVNGEPLAPEHGFPLRLVIPGYYGTNTVKWLWRIEPAETRAAGPFTTVLYNDPDPSAGGTRPVWEAGPEALIVAPAPGPLAAAAVEIWGWAWAAAGIARVEISVDGGAIWSEARVEPRRQWSWQRFAFDWQPGGSGAFTVKARATDARGAVQPSEKARNAIHSVTVTIA
ncbi:MAG TPA: molybdopterin-dependent oxidoreductase [Stellaceae bacterium]|nr:molybdopterin-dependent oxidoreductase [Stellaceae bacterium]